MIYNRHKKEVELKHFPFISPSHYRQILDKLDINYKVIGFCGKVYPAVILNLAKWMGKNTKESRATSKICFTVEDVDSYARIHFGDKIYNEEYDYKGYKRKSKWGHYQRRFYFVEFFKKFKEKETKYLNLFEDNRCPVFIAYHDYTKSYTNKGKIVYNDCLKSVEFYRIFDPYQAFQEISMFFGNMAEPRKPIPEISDEIMCEIKGFNKWSFRKEPSKKKGA